MLRRALATAAVAATAGTTMFIAAGPAGADPVLNIPLSRGLEAKSFAAPSTAPRLLLAWVRPPEPKPQDRAAEKTSLVDYVGLRIMNRRLQDAAVSSARPFTGARAPR